MDFRAPTRAEQREYARRRRETTTYVPVLPQGWPVDEFGLPVIEDHPDEGPDERY